MDALDFPFVEFRNEGNKNAVLFVHGFSGKAEETWNYFAELLKLMREMDGWDFFSFGYPTSVKPRIPLWSNAPGLQSVADFMRTQLDRAELNDVENLAIVAHSMGGLVTQRILLDLKAKNPSFLEKVKHVVMYGTPSGGLKKASVFRMFNSQVQDMSLGSDFLNELRTQWKEEWPYPLPFAFKAVAGMNDDFVPKESAHGPFDEEYKEFVPGNHLKIIRPIPVDKISADILVEKLAGKELDETSLPSNNRSIAENRMFRRVIDNFMPNWRERSDEDVVELALALEVFGRADEAAKILEERMRITVDTDVMGVRAGRLKRSWQLMGHKDDGQRAFELYAKAYGLARDSDDIDQAFYNGINVAFMNLTFNKDKKAAVRVASEVLGYCARVEESDKWSLATEGEANLIMGNIEPGLEKYKQAIQKEHHANSREIESMYNQATRILEEIEAPAAIAQLDALFDE